MYKSASLDSINLPTSAESVLTSTVNPAIHPSVFPKLDRRAAIIPTPNRPSRLRKFDDIQSSTCEDKHIDLDNDNDKHILPSAKQSTTELLNSEHNQSIHEDHNKDNEEDETSFDVFICENFIPFSGIQPLDRWLDQTEILFNRFKISRKLRFKAIPLLLNGEPKRKYIKNRHSITSFDDFYEFMLINYDVSSLVKNASTDETTVHKAEMDKDITCDLKSNSDSRSHVATTTDFIQMSQSCVSCSNKIDLNDTTKSNGDVSEYKSSGDVSTIDKLSRDPVINDLRKAIVTDFIKNPKVFRGNKDDVTKWLEEIDHLMQTAHIPIDNRLDLISYALRVNKYQLRILVDTGATKTFISNRIVHRITSKKDILKQPYSFLLADGLAPFRVLGNVNLTIQFDSLVTTIDAHIAEFLCTDMIIGMDYINKYNLNINVKRQVITIESNQSLVEVPIIRPTKSIKIPVFSSNTISFTPYSKRTAFVSIPISSVSLSFTPLSSLKHYVFAINKADALNFRNYCSYINIANMSLNPKVIKKGACLGHLSYYPSFQGTRIFRSSLYRPFGTTRKTGTTPAFGHSVHIGDSNHHSLNSCYTITPHSNHAKHYLRNVNSSSSLVNPVVQDHINSLVNKVQDKQQKLKLHALLSNFQRTFDTTKHNIARTSIPHVINTIPHSPPASRSYPQPDKEEMMYQLVQEFLDASLISESASPYAAPAMLIKKKDASFRFVVDYKRLNAITIKDSYPLPNMEDTIQKLGKGFSYFSKLDLKSGFYQIPINQCDKEKTAFITPFGLYQFNVLPMGLRNSPPTFQKVMTETLKSCRQFCLVYLDDIIVFSKSFSEHMEHLKLVFLALQDKNLVLNPPKCELAVQQIDYLGHTINKNCIMPMKEKIDTILQIQEPRTLAQANRFLGSLGWYRKFLPHFADVAAPIHTVTNLTKPNRRKFKWQKTQSDAFHQLKQMLITEPLFLHYPVDDLPLILTTDASDIGIGGVLQQEVKGQLHNLYYYSQVMTPCERKYSAIEKEALAIYKCLNRMRSFVLGRNIIIRTDHCPLCSIMQKTIKNARVNRITHLIQEYNIDKVVHIRGRYNCLPDYLSRYSKEQYDDLFDIEYGLASKNYQKSSTVTSYNSKNNNKLTSDLLLSSKHQDIVAAMTLRPRKNQVHYREESIPNSHRDYDDVLDLSHKHQGKDTYQISQNYFDTAKLKFEQDLDPKIQNIIRNVHSTQSQPTFILQDDILYKVLSNSKRSNEKCQVIYLPSSMIDSLLKACHDDPMTGAHFSTDRMYYKILNLFWWPGMKSSIQDYVKSCQLCKQFNISRNRKYGHLRSIPQPEGPFALVGIDYCGPLPITPRDNQYVLVVTDYFTRYITAIALPNCTAVTTAQALFNEYFCKFGIPSIILSDQGTHFQNTLMANLQKLIGYNHIYSTSYHPQTNGVVERFNATFVAQIAKLQCSQHNNWDEFLQPVVFAYNTGIHKSIKFSPYELLYGRAARLPIHPQPTHFIFNKPNDYFEQLRKTLRIFHQASKDNLRLQQQHSKIYYDRNRLNPQLSLGDRVLTRIHNSRGKLDPRFSSIPKVVVEIHHPVYVVEDEYTHEKSQVHISDLRPILSR
ncbi:unnamed protein product [Rotaria magnacalcarata]|uniref:Endonuclease n=1 Tax=Rotaria magnacalcarata TaxID=392030 RepID=A0A8S2JFW7_9BILA|nr:unnamed protein product [Rotaria magnacalcarata]